jgi:hypothetical protein
VSNETKICGSAILHKVHFSTNDRWHVDQDIRHVVFQENFVIPPCKPVWNHMKCISASSCLEYIVSRTCNHRTPHCTFPLLRFGNFPTLCWTKKVKVILRPTVRLGVRHPAGTRDQYFYLLEIFFRQLRVRYFVAPSLTRGRVCNLLLLLVLASTVVLRDSRPYFIVPILETPPTWKARSSYLYPPGTG